MVKTLVWDVDGVLIWHHPSDPSRDWRKKLAGGRMLPLWEEFQTSPAWEICLRDSRADTRGLFMKFLRDRGISDPAAADHVINVWLHDNLAPCEPAITKVHDFARQGYECAIASNQDKLRKPFVDQFLSRNGLNDYPRFISCELGMAKPDAGFFAYIGKTLGRLPDELLLLDDKEINISGARNAGWRAILVDDRYRESLSRWDSLKIS